MDSLSSTTTQIFKQIFDTTTTTLPHTSSSGRMLTPRFTLSQTATHVWVKVSVPSLRIQDGAIEIVVLEQSELHFSASPYFLKLNFAPYQIQDDDDEKDAMSSGGRAQYNPSDQTIMIPLVKKTVLKNNDSDNKSPHDNFWPNLELTARLIQPKEIPKQWLHAVVNEEDNDGGENDVATAETTGEDMETLTQSLQTASLIYPSDYDGYGFANMFHNIFRDYARSGLALEMLQLARVSREDEDEDNSTQVDPDQTTLAERRKWRQRQESSHDFDLERYVQDMQLLQNDNEDDDDDEDYLIPLIRAFIPWWKQQSVKKVNADAKDIEGDANALIQKFSSKVALHEKDTRKVSSGSTPKTIGDDSSSSSSSLFTEEERLFLTTIPYPLIPKSVLSSNNNQEYRIWCGLLDIFFAYTYEHILTTGDPTVESAWTISILSPSLSWLDAPNTVHDACIAFIRRSLCYPYWRSVTFSVRHVMKSTLALIEAGIPAMVKALLQTRISLEKSESYYLGNKLFVDPYLYWIQQQDETTEGLLQLKTELLSFLQQDDNAIKHSLQLEELTKFERFMKEQQSQSAVFDTESSSDEESNGSDSSDDSSTEDESDEEESEDGDEVGKINSANAESSGRVLLDDIVGSAENYTKGADKLPSLFNLKI